MLLHFLKLFGDLVASVSARLAARAGSFVLSSSFAGGCGRVDLGRVGHPQRRARRSAWSGRRFIRRCGVAACGGDMRTDVVRGPFPSAPSRLTARPAARRAAITSPGRK